MPPEKKKNPNRASLGMNLGLNPGQRQQFRQDFAGGNISDFFGAHPGAANRFKGALGGNAHQGPMSAQGAQQRAGLLGQKQNAMGNSAPPGGPPKGAQKVMPLNQGPR